MTPTELEIEIQSFIITVMSKTTYSELVAYTFEGVDLDVSPDPNTDSWILFRIVILKTEDLEISRNGIGIRYGQLHVVINTPKNISNGKRLGSNFASEIEDDFIDYSTTNVNFQKPNTTYLSDVDFHKHLVSIPFYTTVGE